MLRNTKMLRRADGESRKSVRVATLQAPEGPTLITFDYIATDGTFIVRYNTVEMQRVTRSGDSDEAFIDRAVSHYKDAVVVYMLTKGKAADKELAEHAIKGTIHAATTRASKLLKELRGAQ